MLSKLLYSGPSLTQLHEQIAKKGCIDENAGSVAKDSIDIEASVSTVWKVLFDIANWPEFNPVVSNVILPNGVKVDATGSFKLNGFPVRFTFAVVDPERQLTWTGVSLWTKAIDQLSLEPIGKSKTRLHLNESLAGAFVPLMSSSKRLHAQHKSSLESFKRAAEAKQLSGSN